MVEAYHTFASPKVEDLYIGGCIDKLISSCSIVSDHHIVAADFILDIPSAPAPHGQTVTKCKWEKILIFWSTLYMKERMKRYQPQLHLDGIPHTQVNGKKIDNYSTISKSLQGRVVKMAYPFLINSIWIWNSFKMSLSKHLDNYPKKIKEMVISFRERYIIKKN